MLAQLAVDERGRKAQTLERPGRCGITEFRLGAKQFQKSFIEPVAFLDRTVAHGNRCSVAIDPLSDELTHETGIADRFALLLDVQLREKAVIDVPVAPAARDRVPDVVVRILLALEFLPQLSFSQAFLR